MELNLLPKRDALAYWFTLIFSIGIVLLLSFTAGSYLFLESKQSEVQYVEEDLNILKEQEQILLSKIEKLRYVFQYEELKQQAQLLHNQGVDWLPLIDTITKGLPQASRFTNIHIENDKMTFVGIFPSEQQAAVYLQYLRTSPLWSDVFITSTSVPASEGQVTNIEAQLSAEYIKKAGVK